MELVRGQTLDAWQSRRPGWCLGSRRIALREAVDVLRGADAGVDVASPVAAALSAEAQQP